MSVRFFLPPCIGIVLESIIDDKYRWSWAQHIEYDSNDMLLLTTVPEVGNISAAYYEA